MHRIVVMAWSALCNNRNVYLRYLLFHTATTANVVTKRMAKRCSYNEVQKTTIKTYNAMNYNILAPCAVAPGSTRFAP